MADEHRRLTIFPVHGTWGRVKRSGSGGETAGGKPAWYWPQSPLFTTIVTELEAQGWHSTIRHFEWSGANSLRDRLDAGDRLAEEIADVEGPVAIIAHSHGGSVALQAAPHLRDRRLLLVTLATPFMSWTMRRSSLRRFMTAVVPALAYAAVIWSLIAVPVTAALGANMPNWLLIAFTGAGMVQCFLHWLMLYNDFPEGERADCKTGETIHPLLVLRTADDEAGHTIGLGLALSFASSSLAYLSYCGFLILATVAGTVEGLGDWLAGRDVVSNDWSDWPVRFFTFAMLALGLLVPLARLTYGREFFLRGIDVQLSTHTVPDAEPGLLEVMSIAAPRLSQVERAAIEAQGGWAAAFKMFVKDALPSLRHSLHSSRESCGIMAAWLAERLASMRRGQDK